MKTRFSHALRVLSLLLIVALISQELGFCAPVSGPAELLSARAEHFEIPQSVAVVKDSFNFSGARRTIILIEDAHTNYSAQLNAARALEIVLRKSKISHVFLEAGTGDDSLSGLRTKASLKDRSIVAKSFLREGLLSGAEYLDITSDLPFTLWGVEDKALYWQALKAYKRVVDDRQKFQPYVARIETSVGMLKKELYSGPLLEFDQKRESYLNGGLSLADYFAALWQEAGRLDVDTRAFSQLRLVSDLRRMESGIDFNRANREQEKAIGGLSAEDVSGLGLADAVSGRMPGKYSQAGKEEVSGFYAALEEKLLKNSKASSLYPELFKYFAYLKEAGRLDAEKALAAQTAAEEAVYGALTRTRDERLLYRISCSLRLLKGLSGLTLTPTEFVRYESQKEFCDISLITGFINRKLMDLRDRADCVVFLEKRFLSHAAAAAYFYRLTLQRDAAFIKNIQKKMSDQNLEAAVLIAGGYHTPNLKTLLKSAGFNYIVLTPRVFGPTNLNRYEKILTDQLKARRSSSIPPTVGTDSIAGGNGIGVIRAKETAVVGQIGARLAAFRKAGGEEQGQDRVRPTKISKLLTWALLCSFAAAFIVIQSFHTFESSVSMPWVETILELALASPVFLLIFYLFVYKPLARKNQDLERALEELKKQEIVSASLRRQLEEIQSFQLGILNILPPTFRKKESPDGKRTVFTYVSREFEKMAGKEEKDIVGKSDLEIYQDELGLKYQRDDLALFARAKKSPSGSAVFDEVEKHQTPGSDKMSYVHVVKTVTTNALGEWELQGTFQDVTELVQARELLAKQRDFLHRTGEAGKVAGWRMNLKEKTMIWTDEGYRIFGYEIPDSSLTRLQPANIFFERVHSDDVDRVWAVLEQASSQPHEEGKPTSFYIEFRICENGDGDQSWTRWVAATAEVNFDDQGRPDYVIGSAQDITQRKEAEEALRRSEESYRDLIRRLPEPIFVSEKDENGDMRIVMANDAAVKLYKATNADGLIGKKVRDLVAPESYEALDKHMRQSQLSTEKEKLHLLDGTEIWAEVTAIDVVFLGRSARVVSIHDLTRTLALEEAKRERETAELMRQYVLNISHRNFSSLSALTGFLDSLTEKLSEWHINDAEFESRIKAIRRTVADMQTMIGNLRKVYLSGESDAVDTDISHTIETALKIASEKFLNAKGVKVEARFGDLKLLIAERGGGISVMMSCILEIIGWEIKDQGTLTVETIYHDAGEGKPSEVSIVFTFDHNSGGVVSVVSEMAAQMSDLSVKTTFVTDLAREAVVAEIKGAGIVLATHDGNINYHEDGTKGILTVVLPCQISSEPDRKAEPLSLPTSPNEVLRTDSGPQLLETGVATSFERKPVRLLVIDDSETDIDLFGGYLKRKAKKGGVESQQVVMKGPGLGDKDDSNITPELVLEDSHGTRLFVVSVLSIAKAYELLRRTPDFFTHVLIDVNISGESGPTQVAGIRLLVGLNTEISLWSGHVDEIETNKVMSILPEDERIRVRFFSKNTDTAYSLFNYADDILNKYLDIRKPTAARLAKTREWVYANAESLGKLLVSLAPLTPWGGSRLAMDISDGNSGSETAEFTLVKSR